PNERHTGQAQAILSKRKETYEKAKAKHPERWAGKTRDWCLPEKVWLNPVKAEEGKDVKSS
ncbi:putative transposase, partial [Tindallia magadiensis]